jgi:hypothetical protein
MLARIVLTAVIAVVMSTAIHSLFAFASEQVALVVDSTTKR